MTKILPPPLGIRQLNFTLFAAAIQALAMAAEAPKFIPRKIKP
jgi:hypothetical protein